MQIVKDIPGLKRIISSVKYKKTIGFVPTMGALHKGHISLMNAARDENEFSIASIFVNPKQFNNKEDLKKYPRTIDEDIKKLEAAGCDLVFMPDEEEIYGADEALVRFSFGYLEDIMEGKYRPGHFSGVALIVSKLFNIVTPDKAYFGQKDLQQYVIISHIVKELNFNIKLRCMPIIREHDGLAMSSRNMRLAKDQRTSATIFYDALKIAKSLLQKGTSLDEVKKDMEHKVGQSPAANLEYFEIVNARSLLPLSKYEPGDTALCIAGYVGDVRLIDNDIL